MKKRLLLGGIAAAFSALVLAAYFFGFKQAPTGADTRSARPATVDVVALRACAEQGQPQAQVQLGRLYAKGEQVTNSYTEAAKWYAKAAEQGDAEGRLALGELLEAGQGVRRDLPKAITLYRLAAEQGCAGAQYTLGFLYEAGRGVPGDQVAASRWFLLAAEQGDPLAQYDLGQRYDLGVGVAVDHIEAYKWLTLAAAQGQSDSKSRLKRVKAKMTRQEIAEAKRRVAGFSAQKSRS